MEDEVLKTLLLAFANGEEEVLKALLLALITFVINSVLLTLFFSTIMLEDTSKLAIHRDALRITLPGTILAAFSLALDPLLPNLMPEGPFSSSMDVGVTIAGVIWIVLTRRYCQVKLHEAMLLAVAAVIMYLFVFLFSASFLELLYRFL